MTHSINTLLSQAQTAGKIHSLETYTTLLEKVVSENRTTGPNQSADYAAYTKLNWERMQHLATSIKLEESLVALIEGIETNQNWYVLTEAWCGDAAQNIPVIAKIAESTPKINLRFLLRDENPEIMNLFLTDGGKSIPKLFSLDEEAQLLFTWGPRPEGAQNLFLEHKSNPVMSFTEFVVHINNWYDTDKTVSIQKEFAALLRK